MGPTMPTYLQIPLTHDVLRLPLKIAIAACTQRAQYCYGKIPCMLSRLTHNMDYLWRHCSQC